MSYILDALKRADLERERGAVPGLHAQPMALPLDDEPAPRRGPLPWIAAAVALLLLGAWFWLRPVPEPSTPVPPAVPPMPAAQVQPPPLAELPMPPLPVAPRVAPKANEPAKAQDRILRLDELPDDVRRQLPALAIGGSMYSESAANRMLIVNGRLLHEGDPVAPELTLDQIRLKSAVLKFKGYRYQIGY
jgi:general secretion pathway protein B